MNLLLIIGAIGITVLCFLWVLRVLRATLKTALLIAAIVLALQFFGIGTDKVMRELSQIFQYLWHLIPGR